MFDWQAYGEIIVKLPFEIYSGTTFPLMIIFIIFLSLPEWFRNRYQKIMKGKKCEVASDHGASANVGPKNNAGKISGAKGLNAAENGSTQKATKSRTRSLTSSLSIAEQGEYRVHGGS